MINKLHNSRNKKKSNKLLEFKDIYENILGI